VCLKCVKSLTTGYCVNTNLDTVITTNVCSCVVLLFVDEKISSLNEQLLHPSLWPVFVVWTNISFQIARILANDTFSHH